jgi:diadenosine tetraphosphate (Ap4A) HIT family hydrolase
MFQLHERLLRATVPVGDLPLCTVLLLDDARYPWLLLVPRRLGIEEIVDLEPVDRARLIEELAAASQVLRRLYEPFRLNIADIGNRAPQLHIHLVARFQDDPAWPKVVWSQAYQRYQPAALAARQHELQAAFAAMPGFVPTPD